MEIEGFAIDKPQMGWLLLATIRFAHQNKGG
jgi:hypothetical protein